MFAKSHSGQVTAPACLQAGYEGMLTTAEKFLERSDLQRLIKAAISALRSDLMVIADEYCE
jgi:hypothetical protein